jgi:hypothetical protein
MRAVTARWAPAALVPLCLLGLAASRGVALAPGAVAITAAGLTILAAVALARGVRLDPPLRWLGALVGWAAVAAAVRPVSPGAAWWLVAGGVLALAVAVAARGPRGAAWACATAVAAGVACSLWLIAEALARGERPGGPFDNPNPSATLAVLALALVPLLRLRRIARVALGGLMLCGIGASQSRGALLGVVAVAAAWALTAASRPARRAAAALLLVGIAGAGAWLALEVDPVRLDRVRLWGVAARTALAEFPWGSGPGGYADAALAHNFPREGEFARYHRVPALAESDILQLAASLGVPGITLAACLAWSIVRRIRGDGWGVVAGLAATSTVNTQLAAPVVAWVATAAVASVLSRPRGEATRVPVSAAAAGALLVAAATAAALSWPGAGPFADPSALVARAEAALAAGGTDEVLADAEALARRATALRPRYGRAWRATGWLALRRAERRGDADLAVASREAFETARATNPLDAWAAFGEGRASLALGDTGRARAAFSAATALEPNFVTARLELADLALRGGDVAAAVRQLEGAEAALAAARPDRFVSDYEIALARPDDRLLARLRQATGAGRK